MSSLARFRADPNKVRVSVRPFKGRWKIRIENRANPRENWIEGVGSDPEQALEMSLGKASFFGINGIDLEMQGEYPHPMRTP